MERAVCASVEHLPFSDRVFKAIVCVGEVLGYCDPARTIREFSRVLDTDGQLIFDFGSSMSFRYKFTSIYGRLATMTTDFYNGSAEKIWIYNPSYIEDILRDFDLQINYRTGTHRLSAIARRILIPVNAAIAIEKTFSNLPIPVQWSDIITIVASPKRVSK